MTNRKAQLLLAFRKYVNVSNKKRVFVGATGRFIYGFNRGSVKVVPQ